MNEETLLLTFEFKYLFLYSFNYFSKGFLFVVVAKTKKSALSTSFLVDTIIV